MGFRKSEVEELLIATGRRCCLCPKRHAVSVHHIDHKRHGGLDDIDNGIPLCPNCHDEVHGRSVAAPGRTTKDDTPDELRGIGCAPSVSG